MRALSWHSISRQLGAYLAALSSHSVIGEIKLLTILVLYGIRVLFLDGRGPAERSGFATSSKRGRRRYMQAQNDVYGSSKAPV